MAYPESASGVLLWQARSDARLSHTDLARWTQVTQSVISAYESGRRKRTLGTLARQNGVASYRLVMTLEWDQETPPDPVVGRLLRRRRTEIIDFARCHGATNVGVFGSVVRGEDTDEVVVVPAASARPAVALRVMQESIPL